MKARGAGRKIDTPGRRELPQKSQQRGDDFAPPSRLGFLAEPCENSHKWKTGCKLDENRCLRPFAQRWGPKSKRPQTVQLR
jgi:hypothetical protein